MQPVLIGIQARSTSERLPRKAFELISGKMMLDRVIENCRRAVTNLGRMENMSKVAVVVLTPTDDPIVREFRNRCDIVEGSEPDVLSRYKKAAVQYNAEVICRVTGDCPLLPSFIISKMISLATKFNYDYVSNTDEESRTALDGADCEVMSRRMLDYVDSMADSAYDREHVTTYIRRCRPDWARIGTVVHHFDQSTIKLSVDTEEDLARVRSAFESAETKYQKAIFRYGAKSVHRI